MVEKRRPRQQRVRHEAGGSTPAETTKVENEAAKEQAPPTATTSNQVNTASSSVNSGKNAKGRSKKGVAYATTQDKTQLYQPVTIMESKKSEDVDELENVPDKPYKRRGIVSNWSRYDEPLPGLEDLEDGRDCLVGEDCSKVLEAQKGQVGTHADHLRLRGEEDWGIDDQDEFLYNNLGGIKVTDIANTIATIPLMSQLMIDDSMLPKQLAEYYTKVAEDNSRLYNPDDDPTDVVDSAEIVQEQIRKFRISFFDDEDTSQEKRNKNSTNKTKTKDKTAPNNKKSSKLNSDIINNIDDEAISELDFSLNEADCGSKGPDNNVDLTEKFCLAFGSSIDAVKDNLDKIDCTPETEVSENVPEKIQDSSSADQLPKPSINDKENASKDSNLKFLPGSNTFNFGLPKPKPASGDQSASLKNLISSHSQKQKEDLSNIFTPKEDLEKKEEKPSVKPLNPNAVDLNEEIVLEKPSVLVKTEQDTKELEDWLDSVLDD